MSQRLQDLAWQVEDEGYKPGTPQYEYRLLALQINVCRTFQDVDSCDTCKAAEWCELPTRLRRLMLPPGEPPEKPPEK